MPKILELRGRVPHGGIKNMTEMGCHALIRLQMYKMCKTRRLISHMFYLQVGPTLLLLFL